MLFRDSDLCHKGLANICDEEYEEEIVPSKIAGVLSVVAETTEATNECIETAIESDCKDDEETQLMKLMGLPTSFGSQPKKEVWFLSY